MVKPSPLCPTHCPQVSVLDTPFGTAQLNPSRFYDTVVRAAVGLGCELVLGSPVEEVLWDGTRAVGTWWRGSLSTANSLLHLCLPNTHEEECMPHDV